MTKDTLIDWSSKMKRKYAIAPNPFRACIREYMQCAASNVHVDAENILVPLTTPVYPDSRTENNRSNESQRVVETEDNTKEVPFSENVMAGRHPYLEHQHIRFTVPHYSKCYG
ncbi:hypothetical protein OUZ56_026347 [Daphnia magna]|uniref:Uncharacterized protein n=1 Tax=Daphnia magna TaxID=35525 RepID=A0ABQ9ZMV1_9CRUS|nr:hypothetical protein OUZ56_026347 [Daphnia magna]